MSEEEIPVESSSIAAVLYMEGERILRVRFRNGRVYQYYGVPRKTYEGLMRRISDGEYFHTNIMSQHEFTEVSKEAGADTEKIHIQNFRSIRNMTVELEDITILIGANGTGKTTVLDALGLFSPELPGVTRDDFYRNSGQIKITLSIRVGEHVIPSRFLRDGMVEFRRTFTRDGAEGTKRPMVAVMCNRDFDAVREAQPGSKMEKIRKIRRAYPDFPPYRGGKKWEAEFGDYEHRLSHKPEYRDKYYKQFISVPKDVLDHSRAIEVMAVPATRDIAADGKEGSNSYLSRLMNLAIRSAQKNDNALKEIADALDGEYSRYMESVGDAIRNLNRRLDYHSGRYMAGATFTIDQEYPPHKLTSPSASVRMGDGEHMAPIGSAGSGAQRVYLMSLLDTIASLTKEAREKDRGWGRALPVRLIAIDEPELYQHPQRQKMILRSLVGIVEDDPAVRVVCSTHSPYFVGLERVRSLRLLQGAKKDRIRSVSSGRLARLILPKRKLGGDGGAGELAKWLDMSATHWVTEGFFARLVVITEGQGDRNMLMATASAIGIDLEGREISIVPAIGLGNVERFARIFGEFRIPTYLVWDRDGRWDEGRDRAQRKDERIAEAASGGAFSGSLRKTAHGRGFSCVRDNLTVALAADLRGCEDVLGGSEEYEGLKAVMEQDEESAQREGQRRRDGRGKGGGKAPRSKIFHEAQKDFLNSRQNVLGMLKAVRKSCPERLESFTAVEIVRRIDEAGRAASSEITGVSYDRGSRTLRVEFRSGQAVEHHGVPTSAYKSLRDADSRDRHYHMNIAGRYTHALIA